MSDYYRVLVPLDGSRLAEWALAYLPALRQVGELRVTLLSVVDETDGSAGGAREASERESNLLSTYLHEVSADLERHLGINADAELQTGIPAEVILRFEEQLAPDLTIIGTHGRTGLARWRLGSVADKVIRGAGSNTLVIGPKASEHAVWLEADIVPAFKNILVPLDGSELSAQALAVADQFAEAFRARLHLLRVVTPGSHTGSRWDQRMRRPPISSRFLRLKIIWRKRRGA